VRLVFWVKAIGDMDGFESLLGDGVLASALKTSLRDSVGPARGTCQGVKGLGLDGGGTPEEFCGTACWSACCCCCCCCCCFFRSFWDIFGAAAFAAASAFAFSADRLIDSVEVRPLEACAMISFISSFDEGRVVKDQGMLVAVEPPSALKMSVVVRGEITVGTIEGTVGLITGGFPMLENSRSLTPCHTSFEAVGVTGLETPSSVGSTGVCLGDAGFARIPASSSSMSNIKSATESFGRMAGLKGAFRVVLVFLRIFS
jgi:hypothetical protein